MSENKTIRIKTTLNGNDKYLKMSLTQNFDFIEILSLKLSQEEIYEKFCADYGVIVGRIICNNGFGVPNAKVSVFIPISEIDKLNPEIKGLYPYEIITDKNSDGIRYNLLPKNSNNDDDCFTPIGNFPNKREILDNDNLLDVYCRYYKFTTTTNHAGDYMIFGVPLGNYIIQTDVDISDIGILSQKPYDYISNGTSPKLFISPTKFKSEKNLDKLVQVKTLRNGVNVKPFWGDIDNCEIGINRVDFDLQTNITPSAIFIGSIFGDNEKHSINKHCRPRRGFGKLCDMVTGEGTIEMIRKTFDDKIEQFDVNGGRVIDDNGAWAYQIPMNLDYVITDEYGNLIPSDDPNIGIPTRASVRFRIGIDVTGEEGRLRTRAKYLVPNNPKFYSDSDYTFDYRTNENNFRDLYWNKIYSVKNFIPRYQTNPLVINRNMTGIKDVDDCTGTHTPFPYNRLLTELNPIFNVLCIIINIIVSLIGLINNVVIRFTNVMIYLLNTVINTINSINNTVVNVFCNLWNKVSGLIPSGIGNCPISYTAIPTVSYIPCITLECDTQKYAPGCYKGGSNGLDEGWNTANSPSNGGPVNHYPNDGHNGHNSIGAGLSDCYAIQLAEVLNVFEFDFYNDWINGSLYSFLLKYKKRKHGEEKFCEYDCDDFGGGVDGNNNNISDNKCNQSYLVDSCAYTENYSNTISSLNPLPNASFSKNFSLKDGLIKKFEDEFYYASYTHNGDKLLFATDIIHLGSIFDCDWQGIPKIQQYLIPTTYKRPPNTSEYDDLGNKVVCGISSSGGNNPNDGLFFDINCFGITISTLRCQNIKKQCEFGVDLDSIETNNGFTSNPPSCNIGLEELEQVGIYFRDVFYNLNNGGINKTSYPYSSSINTSFTSSNNTPTAILGLSGSEYNIFRNYTPNTNNDYEQPIGNSYYFYFGLIPNKSAIDLLKNRFFTECVRVIEDDFIISGDVTNVTYIGGNDGIINNITVLGNSTAPYTYQWSGPSGFTSTSQNITNLSVGIYKLIVTDFNGFVGKTSFIVNEPQPLSCVVSVNKDSTTIASNDGEIIINAVGGGVPPYYYNLTGVINTTGGPLPSLNNIIISNLSVGNYNMLITDSSSSILNCLTTGLTINSATALNVNVNKTDSNCYGDNSGTLNINITSGVPPYNVLTTCTALGYSSVLLSQTNLSKGTYVVTVQDSLSQINTQNIIINENSQMLFSSFIGSPQCDPSKTVFYLQINDPNTTTSWLSSPWNVTYKLDGILTTTGFLTTPDTSTTNMFKIEYIGPEPSNLYEIIFTNSNGCSVSHTFSKIGSQRPTGSALIGSITQQPSTFNTVKLIANPSGGSGGYTYSWYDQFFNLLSTAPMVTVPDTIGKTYSVKINDSNGCQITSYHTIY